MPTTTHFLPMTWIRVARQTINGGFPSHIQAGTTAMQVAISVTAPLETDNGFTVNPGAFWEDITGGNPEDGLWLRIKPGNIRSSVAIAYDDIDITNDSYGA